MEGKFGGLDVSDAQKLKALETENRRLKKLLAASMVDVAALKDLLGKKLTGLAAGREAVFRLMADRGFSQRHACELFGIYPKKVRREPDPATATCASGCGARRTARRASATGASASSSNEKAST